MEYKISFPISLKKLLLNIVIFCGATYLLFWVLGLEVSESVVELIAYSAMLGSVILLFWAFVIYHSIKNYFKTPYFIIDKNGISLFGVNDLKAKILWCDVLGVFFLENPNKVVIVIDGEENKNLIEITHNKFLFNDLKLNAEQSLEVLEELYQDIYDKCYKSIKNNNQPNCYQCNEDKWTIYYRGGYIGVFLLLSVVLFIIFLIFYPLIDKMKNGEFIIPISLSDWIIYAVLIGLMLIFVWGSFKLIKYLIISFTNFDYYRIDSNGFYYWHSLMPVFQECFIHWDFIQGASIRSSYFKGRASYYVALNIAPDQSFNFSLNYELPIKCLMGEDSKRMATEITDSINKIVKSNKQFSYKRVVKSNGTNVLDPIFIEKVLK